MRRELTPGQLLEQVHELPWDHAIYAAYDSELAVSTPVVLLPVNEEDWDEDADQPVYAREHGLRYILNLQDAQTIVENYTQQAPDHSAEDRLRAFCFYCEHDAYIDISSEKPA
jgi:hypothetical protein